MKSKGSTRFTWWAKWEKFGDVHAEKKVTFSWLMNSNMVKLEKFDHLHLVYHFTVPLNYYKIYSKNIFDSIKTEHKISISRVFLTIYIQNFLETFPPKPLAWLCPGPAERFAAHPLDLQPHLLCIMHIRYALCAYNVHFTNIKESKKKFLYYPWIPHNSW